MQNVNDAEGLSDSDRLIMRNKGRGGKGDDILDRFQTGRGERSWEGLVRGRGGGGCCGVRLSKQCFFAISTFFEVHPQFWVTVHQKSVGDHIFSAFSEGHQVHFFLKKVP